MWSYGERKREGGREREGRKEGVEHVCVEVYKKSIRQT